MSLEDNLDSICNFDDLGDLMKSAGISVVKPSDAPTIDHHDVSIADRDSYDIDDLLPLGGPVPNHHKGHGGSRDLRPPTATVTNRPPNNNRSADDCLICCSPLHMKVTLTCQHSFCYGCIKGQILRLQRGHTMTCPLCLTPMAAHLYHAIKRNPHRSDQIEVARECLGTPEVSWFYAGHHGGYWHYDPVNNAAIEALYQRYLQLEDISRDNRLSICGMTRIFNFDQMVQINEFNHNDREIKRVEKSDMRSFIESGQVKGLAGYQVKFDST